MVLNNFRTKKYCYSALFVVTLICISIYNIYFLDSSEEEFSSEDFYSLSELFNSSSKKYSLKDDHNSVVERYYENRKTWPTSNLGSILFKSLDNKTLLKPNNRTFVILIWKYYDWLKNRHILNFGAKSKDRVNALAHCSVKNCLISGKEELLKTADAVVIPLQRGNLPRVSNRNVKQRWIFLDDESPRHFFSLSNKRYTPAQLSGVFNWSMTYRSISDVPVPYGRTVPLKSRRIKESLSLAHLPHLVPHWKEKQNEVLIAILISNCSPFRMKFVRNLQKFMKVDVYGACSDNKEFENSCPGHFKEDCGVLKKYLFYLVLENSLCTEYLTEKSFYHAYSKGAIPVILGPKINDLKELLPPESFLNIQDFFSIEYLAQEIMRISENDVIILEYHKWRNDFEVLNEHGYFKSISYHYCRVCEALNVNDKEIKVYDEDDLKEYMDNSKNCNIKR